MFENHKNPVNFGCTRWQPWLQMLTTEDMMLLAFGASGLVCRLGLIGVYGLGTRASTLETRSLNAQLGSV